MQVIGALNSLVGTQRQLAWRNTHKAAFAELLGAVAMAQEAGAQASGAHAAGAQAEAAGVQAAQDVVFLDRCVLDTLGYARVRGYAPPPSNVPTRLLTYYMYMRMCMHMSHL